MGTESLDLSSENCMDTKAEVDKNLSDGADEELQLLDMGLRVWKAIR